MKNSWKDFNEVFGLTDEAGISEGNSLGSTLDSNLYVIEVTLNLPNTVINKKLTDEQCRNKLNEYFISIVNEVHSITGTVGQCKRVFEYGELNSKIHLHGYIEYVNQGSIYGLLEQIYKFALTLVKPGRAKENTWMNTKKYPYMCLSCPFVCMNINSKVLINGWENYINKNEVA